MSGFVIRDQPPVGYNFGIDEVTSAVGDISALEADVATLQGQMATKVNRTGDTMTGALIQDADPVTDLGTATKQYVDSIASTTFSDAGFFVYNDADNTKQLQFSAANIDTGTVRTYTAPNESGTLALLSDLTTQFQDDQFAVYDNVDITKSVAFQTSTISTGTQRVVTIPDKSGIMAMTSDITAPTSQFVDNTFRVNHVGDQTKQLALDTSNLTTATTRTLQIQDVDGTIALLSDIPSALSAGANIDPTALATTDTIAVIPEFPDNTFQIANNIDPTKRVLFDAGNLTTASNRTLTVQDADGTIALTSDITTYTAGAQIDATRLAVNEIALSTDPFPDGKFKLGLSGDLTATAEFDLTNVPTATNNTYSFQASSGTLAHLTDTTNKLPLAGGTMTGEINMGNQKITNLAPGTLTTDAVNKQQLDALFSTGASFKPGVRVYSEDTSGMVYDNGTSGVGATLTKTAVADPVVVDGVNLAPGDSILFNSATNTEWNGCYELTSVAFPGNEVYTRRPDTDGSPLTELQEGSLFYVLEGTSYNNKQFAQTSAQPTTIGTDPIAYTLIVANTTYTAGYGIDATQLAANTIALDTGVNTIGMLIADTANITTTGIFNFTVQQDTGIVSGGAVVTANSITLPGGSVYELQIEAKEIGNGVGTSNDMRYQWYSNTAVSLVGINGLISISSANNYQSGGTTAIYIHDSPTAVSYSPTIYVWGSQGAGEYAVFTIKVTKLDSIISAPLTDFVGATDVLAGERGLVIQPLAGDQTKYLRGDATWADIPIDVDFVGATDLLNGSSGLVIQPLAGDQNKYLKGDGTWAEITGGSGGGTTTTAEYSIWYSDVDQPMIALETPITLQSAVEQNTGIVSINGSNNGFVINKATTFLIKFSVGYFTLVSPLTTVISLHLRINGILVAYTSNFFGVNGSIPTNFHTSNETICVYAGNLNLNDTVDAIFTNYSGQPITSFGNVRVSFEELNDDYYRMHSLGAFVPTPLNPIEFTVPQLGLDVNSNVVFDGVDTFTTPSSKKYKITAGVQEFYSGRPVDNLIGFLSLELHKNGSPVASSTYRYKDDGVSTYYIGFDSDIVYYDSSLIGGDYQLVFSGDNRPNSTIETMENRSFDIQEFNDNYWQLFSPDRIAVSVNTPMTFTNEVVQSNLTLGILNTPSSIVVNQTGYYKVIVSCRYFEATTGSGTSSISLRKNGSVIGTSSVIYGNGPHMNQDVIVYTQTILGDIFDIIMSDVGTITHYTGLSLTLEQISVSSSSGVTYTAGDYIDPTDFAANQISVVPNFLSSDLSIVDNIDISKSLRIDTSGLITAQQTTLFAPTTGGVIATIGNDVQKIQFSTGVQIGGRLTVVTPTTFSITDGNGVIVDAGGQATQVVWSGLTSLTTAFSGILTYVSMDITGTPVYSATRPSNAFMRNNIFLGVLVHTDGVNLNTTNPQQLPVAHPVNQIYDMSRALGFVNQSGNTISASNLLTFQKAIGEMFAFGSNFFNDSQNPHLLTLGAVDTNAGGQFQYRMRDGTSSALTLTNINPNIWDDGSTYATAPTVPNNRFTTQHVYVFTSGAIKIQPGQTIYTAIEDAELNILTQTYTTESSIVDNGMLIGYIIVEAGATDLSDPAQARFLQAGKFGNVNGSSSIPIARYYGGLYRTDLVSPFTITPVVQGTLYEVNWTGTTNMIQSGFTGLNSVITCNQAGNYKIDWSVSLTSIGTGYKNQSAQLHVNDLPVGARLLDSGNNNNYGTIASAHITALADNDTLSIYVSNEGNTNDIQVFAINITITLV